MSLPTQPVSTPAQAVYDAIALIGTANNDLLSIVLLSLQVSISALIIALIIGIPIALVLTLYRFPGRSLCLLIIDTLMALPPVVVGLIVFLCLSQASPLGVLGLLYTPVAMVIAQALLITPLVIALSLPFLQSQWQRLGQQLTMLGYRPWQCCSLLLTESRAALITVGIASFGRALAEVGAVMIVGGNIEQYTRVMTTAIAMETRQGNLAMALALGIILMGLALILTALSHAIKRRFSDIGRS